MAIDTNVNANYVSTGKPKATGAVFIAPLGTSLPTDATTSIGASFKSLGFISEDGITNDNSASSDDIRDWGRQTVMTIQSEKNDTFGMTFIESLNPEVLKLVYGESNVTVAEGGAITIKSNATEPVAHAFVIDMVVTGGKAKRIVIPNGKLSELGEISYVAGEAVGYEVTLTALPDTSNNTHYEYIA